MIGTLLAERYRLETLLGEGGMGAVYLGTDERLRRPVAVKVIRPQLGSAAVAVGRFLTEARAAARLSHPGIVTVHDVGEHEGPDGRFPFLVMERVEGESLAAQLARGPLPVARAFEVAAAVLDALSVAHAQGIVHRDVKPDNVLIRRADGRPTLVDFGVARMMNPDPTDPKLTGEGLGVGTPQYMAPEQIVGEPVGPSADLYAVAAMLCEAVTGRSMYAAQSYPHLVHLKMTSEPDVAPLHALLSNHPDAARFEGAYHVIVAALARDPARRPRSAADMANVLRGATPSAATSSAAHAPTLLTPESVRAAETPAWIGPAGSLPKARNRRLALAAGLCVVTLGGGSLLATSMLRRPAAVTPAFPAVRLPHVAAADTATAPTLPANVERTLDANRRATGSARGLLDSAEPWTRCVDDLRPLADAAGASGRIASALAYCEGRLALVRHDAPTALRRLGDAQAADSTWPEPLVGLAEARFATGDATGALAAVRAAAELDPTWWVPEFAVAGLYARMDQGAEAISAYRRAAALAPREAVVVDALALEYHARGMDADADRTAEQALALDPDMPFAHLIRAERALERGDGASALPEAERAVALRPNLPAALLARADALARVHREADALDVYRELLALIRDDPATGLPVERLAIVRTSVAAGRCPPPRNHAPRDRAVVTRRSRPPSNNASGGIDL